MDALITLASDVLQRHFGVAAQWAVRAPGRVNLIGDHTDYNLGFAMPMAIRAGVCIALRPRSDRRVRLHSVNFDESAEFDLDSLQHRQGWAEYATAVAWSLQANGMTLRGFDGVVTSDLPIGSGLSSSAAFEIALGRAFAAAASLAWEPVQAARWMQQAENEWVGVASGIMDPLISASAQPGCAALIDCQDLSIRQVPLPPEGLVVVLNTMKARGLVDSAYNQRRAECEQAAAFFRVASLRAVDLQTLLAVEGRLEELPFRRARHVLSENARVLEFAQRLEAGDLSAAGICMNASHASLRDDFEVSCAELDSIVAAAQSHPACFGARMTGAGFGGCAVALIDREAERDFSKIVAERYERETGLKPELLSSAPAAGVELLQLA